MFIVGVGYTIWTDKLPTDTVLEVIMGKECSTARAQDEGGDVCQDSEEQGALESAVPRWCYRTIAGVDCYQQEIPQYADRLVMEP